MPRITFITPQGERVEIRAPAGVSLMMAAVTNGVDGIEAECGGSLACGTCHVYPDAGAATLPPMLQDEDEMLDAIAGERRPCSRLACQIVICDELDGLVVTVPASHG